MRALYRQQLISDFSPTNFTTYFLLNFNRQIKTLCLFFLFQVHHPKFQKFGPHIQYKAKLKKRLDELPAPATRNIYTSELEKNNVLHNLYDDMTKHDKEATAIEMDNESFLPTRRKNRHINTSSQSRHSMQSEHELEPRPDPTAAGKDDYTDDQVYGDIEGDFDNDDDLLALPGPVSPTGSVRETAVEEADYQDEQASSRNRGSGVQHEVNANNRKLRSVFVICAVRLLVWLKY